MESTPSKYHSQMKYYLTHKDEINDRRREYARLKQREYNAKLRQIKIENGTYKPVGWHRKKSSEVVV